MLNKHLQDRVEPLDKAMDKIKHLEGKEKKDENKGVKDKTREKKTSMNEKKSNPPIKQKNTRDSTENKKDDNEPKVKPKPTTKKCFYANTGTCRYKNNVQIRIPKKPANISANLHPVHAQICVSFDTHGVFVMSGKEKELATEEIPAATNIHLSSDKRLF